MPEAPTPEPRPPGSPAPSLGRARLRVMLGLVKLLFMSVVLSVALASAMISVEATGPEPIADLVFRRSGEGYDVAWGSAGGMTEAEARAALDAYLTGGSLPISGQCRIWTESLRVGLALGKPVGPRAYERAIVAVDISGEQGLVPFAWSERGRGEVMPEFAEEVAQLQERTEEALGRAEEQLRRLSESRGVQPPSPLDMRQELPRIAEAIAQHLEANSMGDAAGAVRAGGVDEAAWHAAGVVLCLTPLAPALLLLSLVLGMWVGIRRRIRRLRDELLLRGESIPGNDTGGLS